MGSCVSKKAGAARESKVAAPLPQVKEMNVLSPVAEEEEEEVKEVVLSETPASTLPRPPPVEKRQELSKAGSGSGSTESPSVGSVAKAGGMQELVKRAVDADAPEKARTRRTASPEKSKPKPKQGGADNGRARSLAPSSANRRQPSPPPTRREPTVVSGIGCRSVRFSPSAARRAAESAIWRTHSAREADMALPVKRSLSASINGGHGNATAGLGGANALSRRDPGERSGRRSESPTASKSPSPSPNPIHRQASATRRAARENGLNSTHERSRPRVRDVGPDDSGPGGDEQPAFVGGAVGGGERKMPVQGALGQNPSVAMECFIFL